MVCRGRVRPAVLRLTMLFHSRRLSALGRFVKLKISVCAELPADLWLDPLRRFARLSTKGASSELIISCLGPCGRVPNWITKSSLEKYDSTASQEPLSSLLCSPPAVHSESQPFGGRTPYGLTRCAAPLRPIRPPHVSILDHTAYRGPPRLSATDSFWAELLPQSSCPHGADGQQQPPECDGAECILSGASQSGHAKHCGGEVPDRQIRYKCRL